MPARPHRAPAALRALGLGALVFALVGAPAPFPALPALPAAPRPAPPLAGLPGFVLQSVPLGLPPRLIEAGDLDGDTDLDLVVLAQDADTTRTLVLRNHGAAGFGLWWQDQIDGPVAGWGLDLDLGDLDDDGDLDLLLIVPQLGIVTRFNAGDGTFAEVNDLANLGENVENELADFDEDGALDIAYDVMELIGYMGTRKGDGSGGFALSSEVPVFGGPVGHDVRAALADVSSDGLPDLLLAAQAGLYVLPLQLQPPAFPSWQIPPVLLASGLHRDVSSGDLDGDGRPDVIASATNANAVSVLLGQTGGLAAPILYPAGLLPAAIAVADLDADGAPDVVVANQRGATVSMLAGDGRGGLLAPISTKVGRQLTDVAPADLDSDGDVDLAVTDAASSAVVLVRNQLVP
jgi:hypothetical protein